MEELLEKIVRPLLTYKDELVIKEVIKNSPRSGKSYDILVASADMGKVIGSKGNIIKSIRTIAKAMNQNPGERVTINVREPADLENSAKEDQVAFITSDDLRDD